MSESQEYRSEVPIHEFRAHTAEILKAVKESGLTYVITNRGEPVAEVVPFGTARRKKGPKLLGMFAEECSEFYQNLPLEEEARFIKKIGRLTSEELDAEAARLKAAYGGGQ